MGLVIIALLPVVLSLITIASEQRRQTIENAHQNSLFLARLAASKQQELIEGARDILVTLSQVPAIQNNDRAACLFFLRNVLMHYPLYANFGAADRNGNVFCMTMPQKYPLNILNKEYFRQTLQTREFTISEYQVNPVNLQAVVTLAYPILSAQDKVTGIVFAELDLRWLEQFRLSAMLPQDARLRVIDQNGIVLASYPTGDEMIGSHLVESELVPHLVIHKDGLIEQKYPGQGSRLYAFTTLPAAKEDALYLLIDIPTRVILEKPTKNLLLTLTALAAGAFIALVVAWFGSKYLILRQVNELVNATRLLSKGDLKARARDLHKGDELSELACAFNDMAGTLEEREREQQRSQEQIKKQKERAETLARIASRLNTHLELNSVLEAIAEEILETFSVPAASILTYWDGEVKPRSHLKVAPAYEHLLQKIQTLGLEDLVNDLEKKQTTFLDVRHYFPTSEDRNGNSTSDVQGIITVVMKHEQKLIGYLIVFETEIEAIDPDELTLLQGIADEAALAITNARLYQALKDEEEARATLLSNLINAQEDERKRIARELHDETSQSLTALLVGLDTLKMAFDLNPERLEEHFNGLKSIAEEMLSNIHRLISNLRPALLDDLGLIAAITWYGDLRLSARGIAFDFDYDGLYERYPSKVESTLFRIVQEAITNIIRHAQANRVKIKLCQSDTDILLLIEDDGVGFDTQIIHRPTLKHGLGLRGMLERTMILGGKLEVNAAPQKGTQIKVKIPISQGWVSNGKN
jgi:signal transduction histidine kinase